MTGITGWREGWVDPAQEHFELRFGSAQEGSWRDWVPVALVGPPVAGLATVQFLLDPTNPCNAEAITHAMREIQFYLIDLRENDPWGYARYHGTTTSNVYSKTHWSYSEAETKKD